jgi:GAF domain-containing protein
MKVSHLRALKSTPRSVSAPVPMKQRRSSRSRFATALAALLDDTGCYDRRQWAHFLDVTESAISQWVRDRTLPSPERLRRILDCLRNEGDATHEALRKFNAVCSAPAHRVSPLSARLGDNLTFGEYLLQPLRIALQRNLSALSVAAQEELLLAVNSNARQALLSQPSSPSLEQENDFRTLLLEARDRLGAASLCYYVADPLLDGDCRLAVQAGVRYPEAMQGPNFPLHSRALKPLAAYSFFKDARSALPLRQETDDRTRVLIAVNPLFGDFVDREGVASCARIQATEGDSISSVLFVNYSSEPARPEQLKQPIIDLFERLNAEALPYFKAHYGSETWGEELHKLPIALQRFLAVRDKRSVVSALEGGLKVIIDRILAVLDLDREDTLGTIHIYEKETGLLMPAAQVSSTPIDELPVLRVADGKGLITWAALRRRAIVVNDLEESEFRRIYHPIRRETRSELALPMVAGEDVVAVLNIESSKAGVFDPHVIRTLALAGSQMALMWQNFMFGKYIWTWKELLKAVDRDLQESLTRIADLARQYVDCVSSDVWRFRPETETFDLHGGNVNTTGGGPRRQGWSYYLAKYGRPVFLYDIQSCKDFEAREWDGTQWQIVQPGAPTELNPMSVRRNVKAQLGIPIAHDGRSFGVLWVKFDETKAPAHLHPPLTEIRALEELVGPAGQILMKAAIHRAA